MIYESNLAKLYDKMFGQMNQDLGFYKYFIEKNGEKALEIGSGTGRLLLNFLNENLNVEGIEPSQDMINVSLNKAQDLNIKPVLYNQSLQNLSINQKYNTIYLPLCVFQNIIQQDEIIKSLKNLYNHLNDKGQVLISIFIPWNDPTGTYEQTWRIAKIINEVNIKTILSEANNYDRSEQIQTKYLKHEIFENNALKETYFDEIQFRCYSKFELILLLEKIGFKNIKVFGDYSFYEADGNSEIFIFSANK